MFTKLTIGTLAILVTVGIPRNDEGASKKSKELSFYVGANTKG